MNLIYHKCNFVKNKENLVETKMMNKNVNNELLIMNDFQ